MDDFFCDYLCRTVGESIRKYNIPDDWYAEFDAYDGVYPIIGIQVEQLRLSSAFMNLRLRIVENPDDEYAGCMVQKSRKVIAFKIDYLTDLFNAIAAE